MNWAIEHAQRLGSEQLVNAFGVIVFEDRHAFIAKVLEERRYWAALDQVSGKRWHIFATTGVADDLTFRRMTAVDKQPSANLELLETFGLEAEGDLPCLLIFGIDQSAGIFQIRISLDDASSESAFNTLRDAIGAATVAIDNIAAANFKNTEGVFAALDLSVTSYKQFRFLKRNFKFLSLFAKLLGR